MKLTVYLDEIAEKFEKAREHWQGLQNAIREENKRFNGLEWKNYSYQGRLEEGKKHNEIIKGFMSELENNRRDFISYAGKVREDSDKVFNRYHQYVPSEVDMQGVAILQNGILKERELIEMAEDYRKKENYTMYFMVAEKLKDSKEPESIKYYDIAYNQRSKREDHELLDGFRDACLYSLRDDEGLSNGMYKEYDNIYQTYKAHTDTIGKDDPSTSLWDDED